MHAITVLLLVLTCISPINAFSIWDQSDCANYPFSIAEPLFNSTKNASKVFRIGAFGTFDFIPAAVPLYALAVSAINNSTDILEDVLLELLVANTNASYSDTLVATQTLIYSQNVSALLGGIYSSETRIAQLVARINNVPEIASVPISTLLANKMEYPYLVRVNPVDTYEAQAISDMFAHYGWLQALVIYCDDEFCTYGLSNIQQYTNDRGVNLFNNQIVTGQTNFSDNVNYIQTIVAQYNIKIFVMYIHSPEAVLLMAELEEAGLTGDDFIYIHTAGSALVFLSTSQTPNTSFVGGVALSPKGPTPGPVYDYYLDLWNTYGTDADTGAFAWYHVDAVLLLAHAVDKLLKSGIELEHISGPMLLNSTIHTNITGVTGKIMLDASNDRLGEFVWYSIGPYGINWSDVLASYDPLTQQTNFTSELFWNGGLKFPSDGLPTPQNNPLMYDSNLAIGLGVLVGIAVLLSVFAAIMLYRHTESFRRKHGATYCTIIIAGTLFAYFSAFLMLPKQTEWTCVAFPWFLGIGFTLTYGCLFIKTWALFVVWRDASKFKRSSVTLATVMKGIGIYVAIECIFLIVWTLRDPPRLHVDKLVDGKFEHQCYSSSNTFWVIFVAVKGAWLLSGVFFSVLTRNVAKQYSESKSIAYATYNNTLLCALAVPLGSFLPDVPHATVVIRVVMIVLVFALTVFFLFYDICTEILFPTAKEGLKVLMDRVILTDTITHSKVPTTPNLSNISTNSNSK